MHRISTHGQRRYFNGRMAPCQQGKELERTPDAEASKDLKPGVSGLRRHSSAVKMIESAWTLSINDAGSQQSPAWHHLQVPRPPIRPVSHVTIHVPSPRAEEESAPPLVKFLPSRIARFAVEVFLDSPVTHYDCQDPTEFSSPGGVGERRKGSGCRYDHSVSIRRRDKVLTYYSQWLQKLAPMVSLMVRT